MNQNLGVKNAPQHSKHSPISTPLAARPGFRSAINWAIAATAFALVVLTSSVQAQTNLAWVASSGTFSTASNWDLNQAPADGDTVLFTNETSITVSLSASTPNLKDTVISNHTGVVTINPNGNTWTVTNAFRIGIADSTSTVYMTSGTLSVASPSVTFAQIRIGDSQTTNAPFLNCVGTLVITNGTVVADAGSVGVSSNSVGTIVVTGNGVYRGTSGGSTLTIGTSSYGNQLIVTNGGKLFVTGTLTVGNNLYASNNVMVLSGPTSFGTITGAGDVKFDGNGGQLIISNGAKLYETGSLLFGGTCNANTGVVTGAGSSLIALGSIQIGLGSGGGTDNLFTVQDGAFISSGGTFAYGNNSFHIHDGFVMGGVGLMSTGAFIIVRSASNTTNHYDNFVTITNAFVTASYLNPQGAIETISILNKATLIMTNSYANVSATGGTNNISMGGLNSTLLINNGTLLAPRTSDSGGGMSYGGAGGNSLIITNGGYLLTSSGTLGGGSSFNTGVVVGASSVWSNSTTVADSTNLIIVGTGGGSTNFLGVFNGATLYNNGSLNIGNVISSVFNTVTFGSPGTPVTVFNGGSLNIGSSSNAYGNVLNITNATVSTAFLNVGNSGAISNTLVLNSGTLSVGFMRVRPTNTVVFTGGTLVAEGLTFDTLANNSNAFVVGDGVSVAVYEMAPGGTGNHNFNNGGLVVTNGAALSGNGTLEGNVTVLGAFSPGGVGTVGSILSSNNLSFGPSAVLNYDIGTPSDTATVTANLNLGGTLNVGSVTGFGVGTYTLFTHAHVVSGTLAVGSMTAGFPGTLSTNTLPLVQLLVTTGGPTDPFTTWQNQYFGGNTGTASGNADPFGKGMSNTNQFLAGFDPTNKTAYVHITQIVKTNTTDVFVAYLGASGNNTTTPPMASRTNVLEFTAGTVNGSYNSNNFASTGVTNILSGGNGSGLLTNMVDPGGATNKPSRYYRVRVLVP